MTLFSVTWRSDQTHEDYAEIVEAATGMDAIDEMHRRLKELGHAEVAVGRCIEIRSPKRAGSV